MYEKFKKLLLDNMEDYDKCMDSTINVEQVKAVSLQDIARSLITHNMILIEINKDKLGGK